MKKAASIFSLLFGWPQLILLIFILAVSVQKPWGKRLYRQNDCRARDLQGRAVLYL